jgi:hypothetical protein
MAPSHHPIAQRLDALADWRRALGQSLAQVGAALSEHELLDEQDAILLASLRERLTSDKLVLAFVAEFSRGKSELINAIFFADAGRRVLPATPGRTTMCPVELRYDGGVAPQLMLLPIETRLSTQPLSELRKQTAAWQRLPLNPLDAGSLAETLVAVTATRRVSVQTAIALGLWSEAHPEDNPPQAPDGSVDIPAWRHALINYPHPLLQRGLVVIDTPGLNAIGAEPELTLGLLPTAHAIVFMLAADSGVTRSDLAIWRDHLGQSSLERFVVLNKIDTLADPMLNAAQVQQQIERQCALSARMLGAPPGSVFALSAREALAARIAGDTQALATSRLLPLEEALMQRLLPRRQQLLVQAVTGGLQRLQQAAARRLADRRRQHAEQLLELRGLRGKSGAKLRMMIERIDLEIADFERCNARLTALRSVQLRLLRGLMAVLSSDALRLEITAMQSAMGARVLGLAAKPAFESLVARLGAALASAQHQADEMRDMLQASFDALNTEFGFAFALAPQPPLAGYREDLDLIAQSYARYLGLGQAWRLATPGFAEQFVRMLTSKLRVVFESAAGDLELWCKAATAQVDAQLGERRRGFARRRDALQRVQSAAGELEQRIGEVHAADEQLAAVQARMVRRCERALALARDPRASSAPAAPIARQLDAA